MAWLDDIQDASFRGVPFSVDKDQTKGGRHVAHHTYVKRNKGYPEDMGRKDRGYHFDAYTLGDDAFAARDALIAALEDDGPGTLIHPTMGTMQVQVEDWTVAEDLVKEMRICRFSLAFVEAGDVAVPTVSADTSAQAGTASDTATASNQSAFEGSFAA
jgi:prophage DNA circulation protein